MIKVIAFDLDDTLLDTSGLLAPKATRDAFDILIKGDDFYHKISVPLKSQFA